MGYVREKYTQAYFLHRTPDGTPTAYGVEGIEEFEKGSMRLETRDILERINFQGKIVIDVGCGRGEALRFAHEHGAASVIGVDFSDAAITITDEYLTQHGVPARLICEDAVTFFEDRASRDPAGQFDILLMLDSVEHIPRAELTRILSLARTLLSHNGLAAVDTPAFAVDNDLIAQGLNLEGFEATDMHQETDGMHCNRYTRSSFRRYMRRCGFCRISDHLFVPHLSIPLFLRGSRWARKKAFDTGHPILVPRVYAREMYTGASGPLVWAKRKTKKILIILGLWETVKGFRHLYKSNNSSLLR